MFSQKVSDIPVAENLIEEISVISAFERMLERKVESCSNFLEKIILSPYHAFLHSSHIAYDEHRPLVISPDILWLTIIQGVSIHINNNAELMRRKFVDFEGKQEIIVINNNLIKGAMENPWTDVFDQFSKEIKNRIGVENHSRLITKFSTTGIVEKAANEIMLMDIVKSYFDLTVLTLCGIPEVILEGTSKDYFLIRDKVKEIGQEYDLIWWTDQIIPLIERIARNILGNQDSDLWKNWYKLSGGSGGDKISGHIIKFFPYIKDWRNNHKFTLKNTFDYGLAVDVFPTSLCSVPFLWKYYTQQFKMDFVTGLIGVTQDKKTKAVRAKVGWAVAENN